MFGKNLTNLNRNQYRVLLMLLMFIGAKAFDILLKISVPNYGIPGILPSFVLIVIPLVLIRKQMKPEEFQKYTLRRYFITASITIITAAFILLSSDFIATRLL